MQSLWTHQWRRQTYLKHGHKSVTQAPPLSTNARIKLSPFYSRKLKSDARNLDCRLLYYPAGILFSGQFLSAVLVSRWETKTKSLIRILVTFYESLLVNVRSRSHVSFGSKCFALSRFIQRLNKRLHCVLTVTICDHNMEPSGAAIGKERHRTLDDLCNGHLPVRIGRHCVVRVAGGRLRYGATPRVHIVFESVRGILESRKITQRYTRL